MSKSKERPNPVFSPLPDRKALARAFAALAFLELLAFGPFLSRLGFYHDDWVLLEMLGRHGGYWDRVKALAPGFGARPLVVLLFPFLYALGGLKPLVYHLVLMAQDAIGGFLFYMVLVRSLGRRDIALAAAALAMVYPVHPVTHHWLANFPQTAAQDLLLASLLLHQSWLESGSKRWLIGGMSCYVLSLSLYESSAFLPLMLGACFLARRIVGGTRGGARALWPYGLAFVCWMLAQKIGLGLLGIQNAKSLSLSPLFIGKIYLIGFDCLTRRLLALCAGTVAPFLREFGVAGLLALGAGAAAATRLMLAAAAPEETRRPLAPALWLALWGGMAVFAAAYLPYALSGSYVPEISGFMSRLNGAGGLAAGIFLAAGLAALARWQFARPLALASLLAVFTGTDWFIARQWAKSWSIQQEILGKFAAKTGGLPPESTVLIKWIPEDLHGASVFIFDEPWGLNAAVRLRTGRPDLRGELVTPWMRVENYGVVERIGMKTIRHFLYQNLFLYDFSQDSLVPLAPPA